MKLYRNTCLCDNCDFCYYGQSDRNFKLRFKEPIGSLKFNGANSNVAYHLIENNPHSILKILKFYIFVMIWLEAFEISTTVLKNIPLMNVQLDFQLDLF